MSIARVVLTALLALALVAPLAASSGASPPAEAIRVDVGSRVAYHWVENATSGPMMTEVSAATSVAPNASASVVVAGLMDRQEANATAIVWVVNVTSDALIFTPSTATLRKEYGNLSTSEAFHFASLNFTSPSEAGEYDYSVTFESFAEANGTMTLLATATSAGTVVVESAEVPVPPGEIPRSWLVAGAAVLVVGAAAGAFGLRQRAIRRRMNEGPRRSQVMRELELEKKMERAKAPEQVAEIQQEIRQAEVVREKRRELQILEAKRADALKTIELLRKRHESGGLTKLQYDNMVGKKQADLARIEAEIAEMERQDRGAAA